MNSFTRAVDLLQREMDVTSLRYQVSANNLANSEVPNFKRSEVNFESELKRALDSACPGVKGIQVEEELVGEQGEGIAFNVTGGVDWDQYDEDQQLICLKNIILFS